MIFLLLLTVVSALNLEVHENYAFPLRGWINIYLQTSTSTQLRQVVWCGIIEDGPELVSCDRAQQKRTLYPSATDTLVHQRPEQPGVIFIDTTTLGGWLDPLHQQWLIITSADLLNERGRQIIQYTHFGMPHYPDTTTTIESTSTTPEWITYETVTTTTATEEPTTAVAEEGLRHSWIAFIVITSVGTSSAAALVTAVWRGWVHLPIDSYVIVENEPIELDGTVTELKLDDEE